MADILLIESDCLLASNTSKFLKKAGHNVSWHVDPQLAIDDADQSPPDIIVLDMVLASARSGIEFLYEFRSYLEWQDLPVIMFSNLPAESLKDSLQAIEQLNIFAYHYKPTTSLADLAQTITQALQPVPA